jgi:hypothetical protein
MCKIDHVEKISPAYAKLRAACCFKSDSNISIEEIPDCDAYKLMYLNICLDDPTAFCSRYQTGRYHFGKEYRKNSKVHGFYAYENLRTAKQMLDLSGCTSLVIVRVHLRKVMATGTNDIYTRREILREKIVMAEFQTIKEVIE